MFKEINYHCTFELTAVLDSSIFENFCYLLPLLLRLLWFREGEAWRFDL
jgi:hypothetical protein